MPEGILPELIIVAALLVLVAGIGYASRTKRTPTDRPPARVDATRPTPQAPVGSDQTLAVDEPAAEPIVGSITETEEPRPSLRDRLGKSRKFLADKLATALGNAADEDRWDDLEAALIQADVGVGTATRLTEAVKGAAGRDQSEAELRGLLAGELNGMFDETVERSLRFAPEPPTVWMIVGVNGTGKTTTIGKLARDLKDRGRSVALAAADTFRAAADE